MHAPLGPSSTARGSSPLVIRAVLGAALVGMAFGVGVVVGRRGEATAIPLEGGDMLAMVDARSEALALVQQELRRSIADELEAPDPPIRPTAKLPTRPKVIAAKAPVPPAPEPEAPTEPPVVDDAVAAAARAGDGPTPVAPAKPASTEPVPSEEGDEGAAAPGKPDSRRLADAMARVLGRDAEHRDDDAPRFTLQVASMPSEHAASSLANSLAARGQPARVVAAEVAGKGRVFRVRVGSFPSREEAAAYKAKLDGQGLVVTE